jgi:hypothetical protein
VKAQVANYFKVDSLKNTILKTVVPLKEVQLQLKLSKLGQNRHQDMDMSYCRTDDHAKPHQLYFNLSPCDDISNTLAPAPSTLLDPLKYIVQTLDKSGGPVFYNSSHSAVKSGKT